MGWRQKGKGSGSHMRREISNKTPVLALVERGGDVRSFPVESVTLKNIKPILQKHIDPKSHLMTDEHSVYYFVKDAFPNHSRINHKEKEYVRREETIKVTTNTVESFFSLIKRGHYGIFHHWDAKYMGQYCAEFNFRYNVRKLRDDERFKVAVKSTDGKRLMLKMPKNVN